MIAGPIVEPLVEQTILSHIESQRVTAAERSRVLEEAERALAEAEAELVAYLEATSALGDGDAFARGAKVRRDAIEDARHRVAEARNSTPEIPAPATVREWWPKLSAEERNHVLRGALDVIWVKRGRGTERIRLIAAGFGPPDLSVQGKRFIPRPADWSADLEGEIRPTATEDAE